MSSITDILRGAGQAVGVAGQFAQDESNNVARAMAQAKAADAAARNAVLNRVALAGIDPRLQGDIAGAKAGAETGALVERARQMAPIDTQKAVATAAGIQNATLPGKEQSDIRVHTANAKTDQTTHATNRLFDVGHPEAAPKAPTEGEIKGAAFVHRVIPAGQLVNQFDSRQALDAIAARAGMLGNWAASSEGRKLKQAGEQWVYSVLRPESGAAISPKEFESYEKTYLPIPFDDDATLAQKRAARRTAEESVSIQAGRALPKGAFTSAIQADSAAKANNRPPGFRP